jgi:hypothetical protein
MVSQKTTKKNRKRRKNSLGSRIDYKIYNFFKYLVENTIKG